jgi:hypothetical protein
LNGISRRRSATVKRLKPWIGGIKSYGIVRIMEIHEHPILHTMKLAKSTGVELHPMI